MNQSALRLILVSFLLSTTLALNCTSTDSSICGVSGSTCQYFTWSNGTCSAPSLCPSQVVWSNATYNCVPCTNADSSLCSSSCSTWNYYFNTVYSICTLCSTTYGSNCLTCNSAGCITCANTFTLAKDNQSCLPAGCSITYCNTCASSTECQTCDSDHILYKGICICAIANCAYCENGICLSCFDQFKLSPAKTACTVQCISNCQSCVDSVSCTTCAVGYQYSSSALQCQLNCAAIDANCISCSSTTSCTSCSNGYSVSQSGLSCVAQCIDPNCLICTNANICTQCNSGYSLSSFNATATVNSIVNCTAIICNINHCTACKGINTCSTCSSLYKLSSDSSSCQPSCGIDNCQICSSQSACGTCVSGYTVQSGSCVAICSIANCSLCSSTVTCGACASGTELSLDYSSCDYNCKIPGCLTCGSASSCLACYPNYRLSSDSKTCITICSAGYYQSLNSTKCVTCPANCHHCDANGICINCIDFYYKNPTDFQCYACSTIEGCYDCQQGSNVCTVCKSGYTLTKGACSKNSGCSVNNCQSCSATDSSVCANCNEGYTLNSGSGTCSKVVCSTGMILSGSSCVCGELTYFSNGACKSCPQFSLTCQSNRVLTCRNGYYPSGNACVSCGQNCITCDKSSCSACSDNYNLISGVCQAPTSKEHHTSKSRSNAVIICPAGCSKCDLDNSDHTVCTVAAAGYVISYGAVYKCDSNCQTCSNSPSANGIFSVCLSCNNGFNLVYGVCNTCSNPNTMSCSPTDASYSLTCIPGYIATSGTCVACPDNCLTCSSSTTCTKGGCESGYYQFGNSNNCVSCFNGCPVCGKDPTKCLKCGDKMYLSNGICYSCMSNCRTCSNANICTVCEPGYLVYGSSCQVPPQPSCVAYNSSLVCTACDKNFVLTSSNTCALSLSCNSNNSCTASNCNYNYYLSATSQCLQCPAISNCLACNPIKSTQCLQCSTGYYLSISSSTCTKCSQAGCTACSSASTCTSASSGFYLIVAVSGVSSGFVGKCGGLCATCTLSELNCLSCQPGAFSYGSQCLSNSNYLISLIGYLTAYGKDDAAETEDTLTGSLSAMLSSFTTDLGHNLGYDTQSHFLGNSTFHSIKKNSVNITFTTNTATTVNSPQSLTSATYNGFVPLTLTSVQNNPATSASNVNLGLVLGVSIPLCVLLIAILIIIKVRSDKEQTESVDITDKDLDYNQQF